MSLDNLLTKITGEQYYYRGEGDWSYTGFPYISTLVSPNVHNYLV